MTIYSLIHNTTIVEFANLEAAEQYATDASIEFDQIMSEERATSDPLADAKKVKCAEVDAKTQQLIAQGFIFDSKHFSLSVRAQVNWLGLKTLEGLMSFPVEVTTDDDQPYSLAQANLNAFIGTAAATVQYHLDSGRALKVQIIAAESEEDLAEIVNAR